MALADQESNYRLIWEAALLSAAGPLSSYLTPEAYGMSVHGVAAAADEEATFRDEVMARLDIGRAFQLAELLESLDDPTTAYRHEISVYRGDIRGKLHMPRLLAYRARGDFQSVPALRAERHIATPENLLISEALRWSLAICRRWTTSRSAEASFARALMLRLQRIDRLQPWASLRDKPREPLHQLASVVAGRSKGGRNSPSGAFNEMARIILGRAGASSLAASAGSLSYLGVDDARFEDRLFELLCLGWLIRSLTATLDTWDVYPRSIKGSRQPVLTGRLGDAWVKLYFQAGHMTRMARWSRRPLSRRLGAIPDIVVEVTSGGATQTIIIDAKNRTRASEGEVAYKMLGYMENLGISPYLAVGIFPSFDQRSSLGIIERDENRVLLLRANIQSGGRAVQSLLGTLSGALGLGPPGSMKTVP